MDSDREHRVLHKVHRDMKKYILVVVLNSVVCLSFAQKTAVVTGRITDSVSQEPLIGAGILLNDGTGTISDNEGYYLVNAKGENIIITYSYIGYKTQKLNIDVDSRDTICADIRMKQSYTMLDVIVVSAGKYEQKLSDVMVSMEIINTSRIDHTNATTLESVIRQTPGVDVMDGQPSIRGGSGYSYGAGSRVLVLIDDLPLISADAGDIKWDYLPVENISQIEIIKGASSVLYGSSALNGVFNIRTAYPGRKPDTRVSVFSGVYLDPKRKELAWWDRNPLFAGASFFHSRRIRNLDLVAGANLFTDEGYRENENDKRARFNINLNHRNPKVSGLSYGFNLNSMVLQKTDFLIWMNADSGAYRQTPEAVSALDGSRFNIDPYIIYRGENDSRHSLRTRFFHVSNDFPEVPDKNNRAELLYGEYKFHRKFSQKYNWTTGLSATWSSIYANLFGNHSSFNSAIFTQLDGKPLDRLTVSLGLRFERYTLDDQVEYSSPVFRTGLNFRAAEYSYLRASFGQGYRFPSIAEKYTQTTVGSLNIFPNPELKSEKGWSAEIGIKQGFRLSQWNGFIDFAAFLTEYKEMIEFTFGVYKPDTVPVPTFEHIGFKALNVGNARISGIDLAIGGTGDLFSIPVSLTAGYTYINPVDLNLPDTARAEDKFLKYRNRHSVKADAEVKYKRFTIGFTFVYNSQVKNIDEVFLDPFFGELILPGFPAYWEKHNTGYSVFDSRFMFDISKHVSLALIMKNIFNKEYMARPGDIYPPRNMTLKLNCNF
jgi:outer membrane cobalamin receptor